MLSVRRIAGPDPEPISLAEARVFLRQDVPGFNGDTMQDMLLESWIRAARVVCEKEIDKLIGAQTFIGSLYSFAPCDWANSSAWTSGLRFPVRPLRSIEQIRYRVNGGSYFVLDPSTYRLSDIERNLVLNHGMSWPTAGYAADSVVIEFTAGLAYPSESESDVERLDDDILTAMRLLIGHFWFNRAAVTSGGGAGLQELPMGVKSLLWSNRSSVGV